MTRITFTSNGVQISRCTTLSAFRTLLKLVANLGPLALNYVLLEGGSGYFRMNAVQPYLQSGQLHLVPGAPHFSFPVYALHSVNVDADTLGVALAVLRAVASVEVK